MARKKWVARTSQASNLKISREKRKWQIALRRYILDKNRCSFYAPYFGIDIENFRKWIEIQFPAKLGWRDFGKEWQFDHVVPVAYFDLDREEDLSLCWNFTNICIARTRQHGKSDRLSLTGAKFFFHNLFEGTGYLLCRDMVQKISRIESADLPGVGRQQQFLLERKDYLNMISAYSSFEFDLLNSGRPLSDAMNEISFFRRL